LSPLHCRFRWGAGDCRCQARRRRQYRFGIRIARDTDGYTIILPTGGHAVSAALYRKLRFHPVDSFDFISLVGTFPFVVATRADGPIASLADLIATARQQPGKLSFSSVGFGSTRHDRRIAGTVDRREIDPRPLPRSISVGMTAQCQRR
jgi:hypothetical protein